MSIPVQINNPMRPITVMSLSNYMIEVNRGNISGQDLVHKFGYNGEVGTVEEDIWITGGNLSFQTSASQYDVTSASANDASAGSGARTLFILGLDGNFKEESETITLDGINTVTTVKSYIRLIRAYVETVGTYGTNNAGNITIRVTGGGDIQATIAANRGQTQKTHYTVPSGKTGYILRASITVESNKPSTIILYRREDANDVTVPFTGKRVIHEWVGVEGVIGEDFTANHILPEMTDVWFAGNVGTGSATISADYDILLIDND